MKQGSLEWHAYRERHANASEAAAVMDCGRFTPHNKRELSLVRNGSITIEVTRAMRAGNDGEEAIRASLPPVKDRPWEPEVRERMVDGIPLSASYDAVSGDHWAEIKIVMSPKSDYWLAALNGEVSESVYWQMLQQQIVGRAYGILHGKLIVQQKDGGGRLEVDFKAKPGDEARLLEAWNTVWPTIEAGEKFGGRDDAEWKAAAGAYTTAKVLADVAEAELSAAKERLLKLADGHASEGCGVSVGMTHRKGSYDYSKLPPDVLNSLPKKPDTAYWVVTIPKEKT